MIKVRAGEICVSGPARYGRTIHEPSVQYGRPVASVIELGDCAHWIHPWLPHFFQNYRDEVGALSTSNGDRVRIIVTAPGHLDSVTIREGKQ